MRVDTLVKGGKVVSPQGIQPVDIGITGGQVACLVAPGVPVEAGTTVDATGRYVLPGCVDVHVHTREPGMAHKEDFATLGRAAAAGGVTTIMCQPTTVPPIATVEAVKQAAGDWARKSVVDFAVQGMVGPDNLGEVRGMLDAGAISMELLAPGATGPVLLDILRTVHECGGLASVPAGDNAYPQYARQRLQDTGRKDVAAWISAWPSVHEAVGVARLLLLTEGAPYCFHVQMVTTRRSVELLRQARQAGRRTFSVETSPKYLLLTEEDHLRQGPFSTVLPRFKTCDDNEAVWEGVLDGTVDMIATDHAPHARAEKEAGHKDVWAAPTGVPEVELSLPLMLAQVSSGRLGLTKLVGLMAETPAREYGIYPQKGSLQVGADADLVLVDMEREGVVNDAELVTAPKYSAFHGFALKGLPVLTMARGTVVMAEGKVVDTPHRGCMVRPRR